MTWTNFAEWTLTIAKFAAMGIAFLLVWTLRNAFIAGWNIHKFITSFENYRISNDKQISDHRERFDAAIKDINERLDKAGEDMSDFATTLQGMPERMRHEFVPRSEVELQFAENRTDRQLLRDDIQSLWKRVNEREEKLRRR